MAQLSAVSVFVENNSNNNLYFYQLRWIHLISLLINVFIHYTIQPSNHPFIQWSVHPSIHPSIQPFINSPTHPSSHSSIIQLYLPSIGPPIHATILPSVNPKFNLFIQTCIYASIIFMNSDKTRSLALQTAQNACIQFIFGNIPRIPAANITSHLTHRRLHLGWLSIAARHRQKLAVLAY